MKNKCKIISILSTACILASSLPFTAFAATPTLNEQTIEVKFRQVIEVSDTAIEDSEIFASAQEAATSTGWVYNEADQRFERLVTYDNVEVSINGNEIETVDGKARTLSQTSDSIEVKVYDPITDSTYTQLIGGDSLDSTVIFDLDISPMFSIDSDNEELEKEVSTYV